MMRIACTCALVVLSSVAASASRENLDIPGLGGRRLQQDSQGPSYAPQPAKSLTLIPKGESCYPIKGNWACDEGLVCFSEILGIIQPGTKPVFSWNPKYDGIGPVIIADCQQPIKKGGSCNVPGVPCASGLTCDAKVPGNDSESLVRQCV